MNDNKSEEIIKELKKEDLDKLSLIYSSRERNMDFQTWIYNLFVKTKMLFPFLIAFSINEISIIFLTEKYKLISTLILIIAYSIPMLIILFIYSIINKIPFVFYLKMKIKLFFRLKSFKF
ncbi:hypothetical protein [Providencia rettgeri]|uniref:hypothetical protein n=1 Tax=Providencia TaxID=586 RepID=UPI001BD63E73|nr:hypothetical protein [Providencia rettgeri]ELR5068969.1 hypothetical protein [Providencia rettgeri]ELR5075349.1 hypothetical protein [Providencia stuartii]ELR5222816.1 hypothetical protein [Providencia rettgeri]MDX7322877.1 hypothetical protein [Providencia rettgeri]